MLHRLIAALAVVLASSACAESRAESPRPTLPDADAPLRKTRAQAVSAYTQDCHATLTQMTVDRSGEGTPVAECRALDYQQSCSPDVLGCQQDLEACRADCGAPCTRCQDTCASGCDDCKAACKPGDPACVRACAEARADCRGRCLTGLDTCRGPTCEAAYPVCVERGLARLAACDFTDCAAWQACADRVGDYLAAGRVCAAEADGMDAFCAGLCDIDDPAGFYSDADRAVPVPEDVGALVNACTDAAQCPSDYAALAPYLGSFCHGTTSDASLAALRDDVTHKRIGKRSLGLLFNTYGAMYGYSFKQERWLNAFFYTAPAPWLPAACRGKMRSVASVKLMPLGMTRLRDKVKAIWNAAP